MDQASHYRSTYRAYPHLTPEEFAEVCHHLESRYCKATLGPLRRRWRLHVRTALSTSFDFDSDHATYLQIRRPLTSASSAEDDELAATFGTFSFGSLEGQDDVVVADDHMVQMDESDESVLPRQPRRFGDGYVTYEIHYHPTYRAPCLWFSLHDLPVHEPAFNVETVFRRLVPDEYKDSLRRVGSVGGISADRRFLSH
ncbi:uncharacterized protein B0I36DRAFT_362622 [Microdochium trichocladiopsis]|uniref:Ubiquitin-like-conjugating enzyme ATG10 n=1 Tax=Microdochium trichocladiopsis TaxID=1682393 RepID=A0A9P9BN23_9PEZI|nr:uncharacterized protein B0I36DRAFT_362622 [Microdochium trichocladiopsis]KAH7030811.1 hypothetical protein B0I36DRAFT_362622 [Microdochium trichocladiopsis]